MSCIYTNSIETQAGESASNDINAHCPSEISLLMKCQRTASVRAVTVCSIYCLAKDDFQLVLNEYPHMKDIMEKEARERLAMIQENFPSSAQHHSDSEPGPSGNTGYTHLMHPRPSTLTVKEEENCSDPGAIV